MEKPILNFEDFELPFFVTSNDDSNDEEEETNQFHVKEKMESNIPDSAIYLGIIETEVENWTSWKIEDDYYIIPLENEELDWAIFRISWDDNWGKWIWSADVRMKGQKNNHIKAAKIMLAQLWDKWGIDIESEEDEPYADFFEQL